MAFLSTTLPPTDGLKHQQNNVEVHVEKENLGSGSLYIAECHVSWINSTGHGFIIPYPAISLHAVSRDLTAYPHECLYLMIDVSMMPELLQIASCRDSGGSGDNTEEEETLTEPEEGEAIREIRFIPEDKQSLEQLFSAMSDCQTLHPDPDDSEPSDGDFEDEFDDAEEDLGEADIAAVSKDGDELGAGVNHNGVIDSSIVKTESQAGGPSARDEAMDTGQFADADMEADQ